MIHSDRQALLRLMPWVFVLIWSTGFVVARLAMPHAPPMGFLSWRYAFSMLALALWLQASAAPWPRGERQWLHLCVTGALMHGGYLGGVWAAVKGGLAAGTAALIVGLQPILTALWISWRGREPTLRLDQWLGLALGLAGLALVLGPRMNAGELGWTSVGLAVLALLSITGGTLYQKRYIAPTDVRSANFVQLGAAWLVSLPFALAEPEALHWHPDLIFAMVWSVLVLTLGGSSLLYLLIQRGAATQVASLLYLVPPCTAVLAWLMFDETMTPLMIGGMLMCAGGVALVMRTSR